MKHILCIDYGEKHCGLALATTSLAEPLETVPTSNAIDRIKSLIAEHTIEELVFGLSENVMGEKTKEFARKVEKETNRPICFHDETLSSYDTRKKVAQSGMSKKRKEAKIDHLVAAAILQDYLDSNL